MAAVRPKAQSDIGAARDPWLHMLASLSPSSLADPSPPGQDLRHSGNTRTRRQRAGAAPGPRACLSIDIVERTSATSLLLTWCDPTSGRYAEQRWILGVARRSTQCALSGSRVRRGDAVFRPILRGKTVPGNADAAILAAALATSTDDGEPVET